MSVTAALAGNITLTDNVAGDTSLSKAINLAYTGVFSGFTQSLGLVAVTPTTLTLPGGATAPVQFLYLRNLATAAGANVAVTWTPNGSSTQTVISLSPGAAILFSETDTIHGITALSVNAALSGTFIEYVLCA